jgi:hypothetical protein
MNSFRHAIWSRHWYWWFFAAVADTLINRLILFSISWFPEKIPYIFIDRMQFFAQFNSTVEFTSVILPILIQRTHYAVQWIIPDQALSITLSSAIIVFFDKKPYYRTGQVLSWCGYNVCPCRLSSSVKAAKTAVWELINTGLKFRGIVFNEFIKPIGQFIVLLKYQSVHHRDSDEAHCSIVLTYRIILLVFRILKNRWLEIRISFLPRCNGFQLIRLISKKTRLNNYPDFWISAR